MHVIGQIFLPLKLKQGRFSDFVSTKILIYFFKIFSITSFDIASFSTSTFSMQKGFKNEVKLKLGLSLMLLV